MTMVMTSLTIFTYLMGVLAMGILTQDMPARNPWHKVAFIAFWPVGILIVGIVAFFTD